MLRKKEVYTQITPIPSHIPRNLAIDILHSHGEIITLNPLVLEYNPIKAPRDAEADEFFSTWYEIIERIQYVPGIGKMGSGKISFKGCFHDMPWGIQTHIYAPMGVDLRNNWRIAGNQPGEPVETRELGVGAPSSGLYLREDVEIKCNITMVSFVKSQMKAASKIMVDRMIKKAELLDAGVLQAMMEAGRLKTVNPADLSSPSQRLSSPQRQSYGQPPSPGYQYPVPPPVPQPHFAPVAVPPYHDPYAYNGAQAQQTVELPGDMYHSQTVQYSPQFQQAHPQSPHSPYLRPGSTSSDYSHNSPNMAAARWSNQQSQISSRPTSYASDASGWKSPPPDNRAFSTELPTMKEGVEEQSKVAPKPSHTLNDDPVPVPDPLFTKI